VPGVAVAWLLAKKNFPGKWLVDTVVNLPLVLPPVVTGYLLLMLFGRNGMTGGWIEKWIGVRLVFDWKGAALASAVVAFPLFVRAARVAIAGVDRKLEQAAASLGDFPWQVFLRITLPLSTNGIIAGSLLAFARALGEFGATIMIAGNIPGQTQTIPLFIYDQLQVPGGGEGAWTLVGISIVISASALIIGNRLEQKHQTSVA
jgi:molybdate transport system permease protein